MKRAEELSRRLWVAMKVLAGRPVMYRVRVENASVRQLGRGVIVECSFVGDLASTTPAVSGGDVDCARKSAER